MRKAMAAAGKDGAVPDNPLVQVEAGPGGYYKLSPEAQKLLGPIFKEFGFDPSEVDFKFGWTPKGVSAYTVGDEVIINPKAWSAPGETGLDRLELVAHEATHSAQYDKLGIFGTVKFLSRYSGEYGTPGNYNVPASLSATPISSVNILDTHYTLDQLAERVANEVGARYGL